MLQIEIDTHDRKLAFELFETKTLDEHARVTLRDGTEVQYAGSTVYKAVGIPETIELVVEFGSAVASGLVASWLYGKLRGRDVTLRIERTEVELEEGQIKRILRETVVKE